METKNQGSFSLGMKSVELQISTLFSDCGGEQAIELMDVLSRCSADDQRSLLKAFLEAASQRAQAEAPPSDFEEELLHGLLQDFDLAASAEHQPRRLTVVEGGKHKTAISKAGSAGLIDLTEARRLRKRG